MVTVDFRKVRAFLGRWATVLTLILAFSIGGTSWYQLDQQHKQAKRLNQISACQAEYNQAFAQQILIRSALFQASDDTRTDLLGGLAALILLPPSEDPKIREERGETLRTLFQDYLTATDAVEKARSQNPLPPIPDCT